MWDGVKRFVLLLALVVLPAQSATAAFYGAICHGSADGQSAHLAHAGDGHDHGAQRDSHSSDDGTAEQSEHFSCHPLVSVLPALTLLVDAPNFSVWAIPAHGLSDLFVPERPQRPPLA